MPSIRPNAVSLKHRASHTPGPPVYFFNKCPDSKPQLIFSAIPSICVLRYPSPSSMLTDYWLSQLHDGRASLQQDNPNYYAHNPSSLISSSSAPNFVLGTGSDVFDAILPSIEAASHEVLFVTCFWASSPSLQKLGHALRMLSRKAEILGSEKIRVRIGFSSLSLLQKVFHTTALEGQRWGPETWSAKLGLPRPEEVPGLDLQIKSIFVLPFSVCHPKFIVVDRKRVWLPSCNVSWEEWFEGGVELSGEVVVQFVRFWQHFWARGESEHKLASEGSELDMPRTIPEQAGPAYVHVQLENIKQTQTIFLPSPHRRDPKFQPFAKQEAVRYPKTPLNVFLISLISRASKDIYLQTPNVTAPPVLSAILSALHRGINVHIVTSERLMILEQLVTGGTTTKRCLRKLIKRYKRNSAQALRGDEEMAMRPPGHLRIDFFQPRSTTKPNEPVQSHLKLTIVDQEWTVLGSGNMDRASWFTSQELGVAFHSISFAQQVRRAVSTQLSGRHKTYFESS